MTLTRSNNDSWIAGVAGGLAESLGIDSTIVRIVFVVLGIVSFGAGVLLYLALWAILPRPTGGTVAQDGIAKARDWNNSRKSGGSGNGSDFTI